jgi:flagellar hook-basal body complex protein FliE
MSIEANGAVSGVIVADGLLAAVQPPAGGFAQWFTQEVGQVNASMVTAQNDVQKLVTGETQNLHEVMIHMEEAKLSFQLLAQVRTRLLEAYQEVMRTQV